MYSSWFVKPGAYRACKASGRVQLTYLQLPCTVEPPKKGQNQVSFIERCPFFRRSQVYCIQWKFVNPVQAVDRVLHSHPMSGLPATYPAAVINTALARTTTSSTQRFNSVCPLLRGFFHCVLHSRCPYYCSCVID